MENHENADTVAQRGGPWNKGKLIGQKPPLRSKHVWSIARVELRRLSKEWTRGFGSLEHQPSPACERA